MKRVIPTTLALSLAVAAGLAQAQTAGTTTGNPSGTAPTAATTPGTTMGNPSAAATSTRAGGLGSPAVGLPNDANRPGTTNNAVNTKPDNNPGAPHAGANSFTEGQARSRIEDKGFAQVSGLKKDDQGIWRGQATKDGKQTSVALDYQGNVVAQ